MILLSGRRTSMRRWYSPAAAARRTLAPLAAVPVPPDTYISMFASSLSLRVNDGNTLSDKVDIALWEVGQPITGDLAARYARLLHEVPYTFLLT